MIKWEYDILIVNKWRIYYTRMRPEIEYCCNKTHYRLIGVLLRKIRSKGEDRCWSCYKQVPKQIQMLALLQRQTWVDKYKDRYLTSGSNFYIYGTLSQANKISHLIPPNTKPSK